MNQFNHEIKIIQSEDGKSNSNRIIIGSRSIKKKCIYTKKRIISFISELSYLKK